MESRTISSSTAKTQSLLVLLLLTTSIVLSEQATALEIEVTVENLSADNGLFLTPAWVGFHDGSFDLYDLGVAATAGLQQIAEDGDPTGLRNEFSNSSAGLNGGIDGVIFGPAGFPGAPIIDPGEITKSVFNVDPVKNKYFSYASMVIPSNDAFIANGNPLAHLLFDASGNFIDGLEILILGSAVRDAGTEINNEIQAAFFNQTGPNQGDDENGVVSVHSGFIGSIGNPVGNAIILGGTNGAGFSFDTNAADFTANNFQVARISIAKIPEPGTFALFGLGLLGLSLRKRQSVSA